MAPGKLPPVRLLLTLVVLVCTALVMRGDGRHPMAFAELLDRPGTPAAKPLLVLTFQHRDCGSNLGFLAVLQRPELESKVDVLGLFRGSSEEFDDVIPRLEARYPHVRFQLLERRQERALALLGHRSTPFWLFVDASGAVRRSGPAPAGPTAYPRFAQALGQELAGDLIP